MGSSGSKQLEEARRQVVAEKEKEFAARLEERLQEEASTRRRLMQEAHRSGKQDGLAEAAGLVEAARLEDLGMGLIACFASVFFCALYHIAQAGATTELRKQEMQSALTLTSQHEVELAQERQRMQNCTLANNSQLKLLENQERMIKKQQQRFAQARAKFQLSRLNLIKMKRRNETLRIELTTLREQNGMLYQRFIGSTSGAIIMACVAAGFAIASHGSHGADAHPQPAVAATETHAQSSTEEKHD